MKFKNIALIVLLGTAVASSALAQGGPGRGRYAIGSNNTAGWTLMTPEEHQAHQQKMWSFTSYDECKAYQQEHHQVMQARAKEQGKTLLLPRANACDRMKVRGLVK